VHPALPDPGRCVVIGILNVTPDSFSDGGRYLDRDDAVAHGLALHAQGADLVDIGGESTRPGAQRGVGRRLEASCRGGGLLVELGVAQRQRHTPGRLGGGLVRRRHQHRRRRPVLGAAGGVEPAEAGGLLERRQGRLDSPRLESAARAVERLQSLTRDVRHDPRIGLNLSSLRELGQHRNRHATRGFGEDPGRLGEHRGGAGVVFEFQVDAPNTIITARGMERFHVRPWGRAGAAWRSRTAWGRAPGSWGRSGAWAPSSSAGASSA